MKEREELINNLRNEFVDRCKQSYKEGSIAFFDNSEEALFWIDTLITEVGEEQKEIHEKIMKEFVDRLKREEHRDEDNKISLWEDDLNTIYEEMK